MKKSFFDAALRGSLSFRWKSIQSEVENLENWDCPNCGITMLDDEEAQPTCPGCDDMMEPMFLKTRREDTEDIVDLWRELIEQAKDQVEPNKPTPVLADFVSLLLRSVMSRGDYDVASGDLLEAYQKDINDFGERKANIYYFNGALSHVPANIRVQIMSVAGALWGFVTGMFS